MAVGGRERRRIYGSRITRNPMNGPSVSQKMLFGICGSVSCHFRDGVLRAAHPTSSALSMKEPPHASGAPSGPVHHSAALPIMSRTPKAFGARLPIGCVASKALSQYQACSSSASPGTGGSPARQAYSHSASVGKRYVLPVRTESQSVNRLRHQIRHADSSVTAMPVASIRSAVRLARTKYRIVGAGVPTGSECVHIENFPRDFRSGNPERPHGNLFSVQGKWNPPGPGSYRVRQAPR